MIEIDLMNAEYAAWMEISEQLKEAGFSDGWDSPELRDLHAAVVLWGERLVALRIPQTSTMREAALNDAVTRQAHDYRRGR